LLDADSDNVITAAEFTSAGYDAALWIEWLDLPGDKNGDVNAAEW